MCELLALLLSFTFSAGTQTFQKDRVLSSHFFGVCDLNTSTASFLISFHFRQVNEHCCQVFPCATDYQDDIKNHSDIWKDGWLLLSSQLFRPRRVPERFLLLPYSIRRRRVSKDTLFLPCGIFLHLFPLGSDQLDPVGHVHSCWIPTDEEEPLHHQSMSSYHPKIFVFPSLSGGRFTWRLLRGTGNVILFLTLLIMILTGIQKIH